MISEDLWQRLESKLLSTLIRLYPLLELSDIYQPLFILPKNPAYGDLTCNIAMSLAKKLDKNPHDIAIDLVNRIKNWPEITKTYIAKPGFINVFLSFKALYSHINYILNDPDKFSRSNIGQGKMVNIEYVSANPTGPLHIGHARGAVFGDVLANLLSHIGFDVTREYYINDAGMQADTLARSVYQRYLQTISGNTIPLKSPLYPGEYLIPIGKKLAEKYGKQFSNQSEKNWLPLIRNFAVQQMMNLVRSDLATLGVNQDVFTTESSLLERGDVNQALNILKQKGLLYQGVLNPPRSKHLEDWESRRQLLFRSTSHGDDVDRPLIKADGSYSYLMPDIAYHYHKINRGFDWLINIFGADHIGYVKRLKAAVRAFSTVRFDIICTQIVNFTEHGKPVKMSKRSGSFISISDLIDKVGKDVVRIHLLGHKNDAHMCFDLEQVIRQSLDNPVFYIHYAHARCHSAMIHAAETFTEIFSGQDILHISANNAFLIENHCKSSLDRRLIMKLVQYPTLLRRAGISLEVYRLATYLRELSKELHAYWNLGREQSELRVVIANQPEATLARIALISAVKCVLADGLKILGIEARNELR